MYQVGSGHIATRWPNVRAAFCAGLVIFSALILLPPVRAVDVLTDMNDNNRTGRNSNETFLNTGNVNQTTFGKVWAYSVNGSTYAQPLYASGINIAGGLHNVVFIETMDDDAYAFDADSNTQLWHVSFVGGNITPVPIANITGNNGLNIVGNVGIESTPYIDKTTGTIYMLARTLNTSTTTYIQTLHALDITTGAEKFGGPVVVTTSGFNSKMQNQRMGLAMANGNIIITWTSHEDDKPYNGWIMAYNATTLAQAGVFNDTASGSQGGIWQQGRAPAVDASGNVYVITGNGTWDGSKNFGESFLKLNSSLSLQDWFTPDNYNSLNSGDVDLGSGGAMLIPNSNVVFGGGKSGTIYLCDTRNMGHELTGNGQIIQSFSFASGQIRGGSVYYVSPKSGAVVYDMASGDHLKEYSFNGTKFSPTTPIAESTVTSAGLPGGFLSVSDNNGATGSGIVWATIETAGDDHGTVSGIVRAWDADNIGGPELWDSNQNATRDALGTFVKDANPTVANGRVYVGSYSNRVNVYGLLGPLPVGEPVFTPGGGTFTAAQNVSISSSTSGASFRYTTDGVTIPTETVGTLYSGPINISSTTTLMAIAFKSGMTDSPVTNETYTINTMLPVVAPVFTPSGGTFTSAQNVSISTTTSGATINYTTDGSTPSETNGIAYLGTAIDISSTTVLKAIAFETGFTDSTVTSETYTIGTGTTFNFEAASMSPVGTGATVSTSSDPNVTGGLLEFLNSTAAGQSMTLTTPSIPAGTYQVQFRYKTNTSRAQHTVTIDGTQVGGTIDQYATTPSYPTATLGNVTFASDGTHTIVLTVTGKDAAATKFYITADKFTFISQGGEKQAAAPVFTPGGGSFTSAPSVSISSATSTALIRYTTDGSTPTETNGLAYSGPVNISTSPTTLQAIAYGAGLTDSTVTSETYTIAVQQVAAPVFSPASGAPPLSVAITTATGGATINYTTDGSTPTETNGTMYPGAAISIPNSPTTLKAIAFESGFADSTVTSATYSSTPPTFNFEAASMSPVGTGATVSTSSDPNVTGGLLEFLNSTAVGQSMTLTTPSMPAGTYQVQFRYKTNTSRCQHNVTIDGTQIGGTIDQYATTSSYPTATLGNVTFASDGTHTIVLTVTGKDAAATHFYISADKFTFIGQ